jgi:hypothetical protein
MSVRAASNRGQLGGGREGDLSSRGAWADGSRVHHYSGAPARALVVRFLRSLQAATAAV